MQINKYSYLLSSVMHMYRSCLLFWETAGTLYEYLVLNINKATCLCSSSYWALSRPHARTPAQTPLPFSPVSSHLTFIVLPLVRSSSGVVANNIIIIPYFHLLLVFLVVLSGCITLDSRELPRLLLLLLQKHKSDTLKTHISTGWRGTRVGVVTVN